MLAIIGGGNMARAIILGAIDARLLSPTEIVVCEPDATKRRQFASWGVQTTADHGEACRLLAPARIADPELTGHRAGHVLLAVKPQSLEEAASQLAPHVCKTGRPILSILAGTPIAKIRAALGDDALPVVRIMPNTPARLRKSMTAIATADESSRRGAEDHSDSAAPMQFAYDLFASLGEVVKIDESLMDAFTALAGSGPAYVFYLAEAMIAAAQEVGFDRITADRVVRQTIAGAAALLGESGGVASSGVGRGLETPESLRIAVTSKGGTTEAAVRELDAAGVNEAMVRAIVAGRDRAREMAQ